MTVVAQRTSNGFAHPGTDLDREEVRKELRQILASPVFQNSKRYAAVLKYIVHQTLEGNGDRLKERTIGIEVFHRAPDYDTATDHVVRSAVAEIRKRLALYYQEGAHGQFRIEVLPGSYTPQFRRIGELPLPELAASDSPREQSDHSNYARAPAAPISVNPRARLHSRWLLAAGVVLVASVVALIVGLRPPDTFERFWQPILSSHEPVLICIGNMEGGRGTFQSASDLSAKLTLQDFHNLPSEIVDVDDAITVAKFAGLMEAKGRQFEIKSQSEAIFTDFQNGPTILIGLLNNNWSERLMPKLRFTIEHPSLTKVTIRDHDKPSGQDWSVDYATPYLDVTRDYALVLRMRDPQTEQMVVVAAGITVFGTTAAGDFLTNGNEMGKLAAIAPPGWEKKNMEIVLSTDVIRGRSGPATVVAAQFW
jgi:hypothetical protein